VRLREDEALLPPGPWEVWTSCSYRRIKRREGHTTKDVLHAYNQRGDDYPDLSMPEEQLSALSRIRNDLPTLLNALSEQRAEIEGLKASHYERNTKLGHANEFIDALTEERDSARKEAADLRIEAKGLRAHADGDAATYVNALSQLAAERSRVAELEQKHHERGVMAIGLVEHAGAHLCRAEKVETVLREAADYLDRLERELLAVDADMKIGDIEAPSSIADKLRSLTNGAGA
jgi:chromosome segregation ATPase